MSGLENFQEHRFSSVSREFVPVLNYPPSDFSPPLHSAGTFFRHWKAAVRCSLNSSSGTQGMCDLITLDESRFFRRHLPQSSSKAETVLLCSPSKHNSPGKLASEE